MIDTQHDQPSETASATAPAVEKSVVPSPEPSAAPEASSTQADSAPKQEMHWFKKGFRKIGEGIGIVSHGARNASIAAMPNAVVNNASNLAGALHMVSEVAMYKANGTMLMQGSKGRLVDYIICPPKNIFNSMMGGANLKFSPKELLKPSSYIKAIKGHFDLKGATQEDWAKNELTIGKGQLVNHWQARSTMVGMTVWGLNMLLPDVKDTPEETERMSIMATNHPVKYVATRLKQALWVPDWFTHKRQMTGLGVMVAGICSFLGGWRNVNRGDITAHKYYFNPQYAITGLISFAASIPLLFAVDNDKGYSLSGLLHLGRCAFLPGSIMKKYKNNEKGGAHYYALGHLGLQSENLGMALLGGAEKREDGTIVDHKAIRDNAKAAALKVKGEHPQANVADAAEETPSQAKPTQPPATKVRHAGDVALAMPERHAIAKAEHRDTVNA